ncbi:MAG: sortase [Anaerolineales bacterium]
MAKTRPAAEDLSIDQLEAILAQKRLEARGARLRQFRRSGRAVRLRRDLDPVTGLQGYRAENEAGPPDGQPAAPLREGASKLLLGVEVAAVLGLLFVLLSGVGALRSLNQEVSAARLPAAPTPLITAVVLPSGHTPPTAPGGAQPNESEIPAHLRPLVQSMPAPEIPTPSVAQAQRIYISALWDSAAPVVQGDGWEQLKKGVAQHIGSANPGEAGNVVLSAHNDIFGELFRDLNRLKPGDDVVLSTGVQDFVYKVTGLQIVGPTEVGVMEPTARPTITLISCYPYLVDTQRIVVTAELVES